jgi:hypothetical protein
MAKDHRKAIHRSLSSGYIGLQLQTPQRPFANGYKALHERDPMTVGELAAAAGVNERYLREWLAHQAASNYLSCDATMQKFALPPEQAMVFAIEDSPVYMMGAFDLMTWMTERKDQVQAVFPAGGGVPWSDGAPTHHRSGPMQQSPRRRDRRAFVP